LPRRLMHTLAGVELGSPVLRADAMTTEPRRQGKVPNLFTITERIVREPCVFHILPARVMLHLVTNL
jgi:hypothetical protein